MDARTQAADRELDRFRRSRSDAGRFEAYCRGRVRHCLTRMALILVWLPVVLTITDLGTALVMAGVAVSGELIDCLMLAWMAGRVGRFVLLPTAIALSVVTAGLQALTIAYCVARIYSLGHGSSEVFAMAIFLSALFDAAMVYGLNRGAAMVRLSIYGIGLSMILLETWFSNGASDPALLFDGAGILLLSYVVWAFVRHLQKAHDRSSATQLATLEHARTLAHVNVALEESRQTARRLAMVAERANDSVIITDKEGYIIWVNGAFTDCTGYMRAEAVGRHVTMLNGPETNPEVSARLDRARHDHRPARVEIVNHHRDGHPLWIEVSMSPVFDDSGALQNFVSVERDISEAKRREVALAEARRVAEDAVRARDNFLATMSHEIRTPMNGVIGTADLLLDTRLDDTQRTLVRTINASGEALLAIVNDILDFSKLEAGKLEVAARPFSPGAMLQGAVDLVAPLAEAKGLALQLILPASLPERLEGDEGRLRQVLLNLLGNAIKFTETGSIRVEVGVRLDGARCHLFLTVRDTGIGIPPDRLDRIFESFTQADANVAGRFGGTGLGLAISRLLLQAMGGEISVSSEPGAGSIFFVSLALPIPDADAVTPAAEILPPADDLRLEGLRILVAEDNRTNTLLIDRMLAATGADTVFAVNGREAVELFRLHAPDLVLMDVHMPILDGLCATEEIRRIEAAKGEHPVPIVALTANAFAEDRALCLAAGMTEVMTKPFRKADLIGVLHRTVDFSLPGTALPPPRAAARAGGTRSAV